MLWDLYTLTLGLDLAHHDWCTLPVFIPLQDCGWYVIYIKDHVGSTSGHTVTDLCRMPLLKSCKMDKISLNSNGMLLFSLIWGFFLCGIFDGSSYSKSINSSDTTGTCEVLTLNLILLEDDLKWVTGCVLCGEGGYILKK